MWRRRVAKVEVDSRGTRARVGALETHQATPLPSPSLGTSFSAETLGYYGPMSFYVLSIALTSTVKIDDQTTGLKQGAFTLSPGESAEISGGPVTIVAIGQ
jgi:hypothetical protein